MQEVVKVVMAVALRWLGQADGWACAASRAEVSGARGQRQRRDGTREMGRGRRSRQKIQAEDQGKRSRHSREGVRASSTPSG
jgi:hypothetical protein